MDYTKIYRHINFENLLICGLVKHWCFHDGWVVDNCYRSGKHVIQQENIIITWIFKHYESKSTYIPKIGESVAIHSESLDFIKDDTIFDVYVYKIEAAKSSIRGSSIELKLRKQYDLKVHYNQNNDVFSIISSVVPFTFNRLFYSVKHYLDL